jgi:hypothetical protein
MFNLGGQGKTKSENHSTSFSNPDIKMLELQGRHALENKVLNILSGLIFGLILCCVSGYIWLPEDRADKILVHLLPFITLLSGYIAGDYRKSNKSR